MAEEKVAEQVLNSLEIDTIGEILNISMGSAATAVSKLLDRRVNITTPEVMVLKASEIEIMELVPAVGVEITYVEGNVQGKNYLDLQLMTKCQAMILSNSAFSYLAALLNPNRAYTLNLSDRIL